MSLFQKYLKGWTFRSTKPSFDVGDEISVFIAKTNGTDAGLAYIGDTKLLVDGAGPETVEKRVRLRVTEFDEAESAGRGEFLEIVGQSSYTD
ncbi:TRAM domain-containing protein [Natronococcus pandeyae]|uniref:TRAM domain-containing protein n=1 Tax=Natronococcus pandeyae TaxID=2055836 RepID=A0A8J8Q8Q3_9EURY|nr:TRAM domain-containing protein [Natronococcus pandeyae]TYL39285.1 TRAM domain-containing protein [Natronococcus pandeyae]